MAANQISTLFSNLILNENSNEKKSFVMKMLYAKHILKVFPDIVKEKCYGCQVNHPSQKHHDVCLQMTNAEKVEICLDTALARVNDFEIYEEFLDFFPEVSEANTTTLETYDNEKWRNELIEILLLLHF